MWVLEKFRQLFYLQLIDRMENKAQFKSITPGDIPISSFFNLMLGAIGPRPIALVSSLDAQGQPNLAPFSFFNGFGANPPILIFSPARRGRDSSTKHTYNNVKVVPEVVINVVSYSMVQQVSLASTEFPEGVNEFEKVGFTSCPSELVKPSRVAESPVQFECKVLQVIETGFGQSAGNLVICEILKVHVNESLLQENGLINQEKIDLVGRMGGNFYVRASGQALFEVEKPLSSIGIGVDSLPEHVRNSHILTGNDLGRLGNLKAFPSPLQVEECRNSTDIQQAIGHVEDRDLKLTILHNLAQMLIAGNQIESALQVLLLED